METLPVKFCTIATELVSGHEIWLTRGPLVQAMRASYALPGVFDPVMIGGRWLMDGALVNPIPITAARALGADIVICVNLNGEVRVRGTVIQSYDAETSDQKEIEEVIEEAPRRWGFFPGGRAEKARKPNAPGLATVMVDAFNITQDRIARSRLAGDPPDIMIAPKLAKMGLFEFHRAQECIALGGVAPERDGFVRTMELEKSHLAELRRDHDVRRIAGEPRSGDAVLHDIERVNHDGRHAGGIGKSPLLAGRRKDAPSPWLHEGFLDVEFLAGPAFVILDDGSAHPDLAVEIDAYHQIRLQGASGSDRDRVDESAVHQPPPIHHHRVEDAGQRVGGSHRPYQRAPRQPDFVSRYQFGRDGAELDRQRFDLLVGEIVFQKPLQPTRRRSTPSRYGNPAGPSRAAW